MNNKKSGKNIKIQKKAAPEKPEKVNGFTRRKEQSKEDIRKAATELFRQFGIEKVNISDIARKAGVSQATIYNNFGSKDSLVREFVIGSVDRAMAKFEEISTSNKTYSEKLQDLNRFIAEINASEIAVQRDTAMFPINTDIQNDPDIKKIRDTVQEKMAELLVGVVREGKKQGQVSVKISDEALTIYFRFLMNMFFDIQTHYRFHQDPKLAQDIIFLLIHGIGGEEKAASKKQS